MELVERITSALGVSLKGTSAENSSSPSFHFIDLPQENDPAAHVEADRAATASSSAASAAAVARRARNATHRADDVEFAFEIGSGLLTEVRRLQGLLEKRDKAIQGVKEENDELQTTVKSLRIALRQQEQSADKFKEENWNLEVSNQGLRTQLTDMVTTNARLESEQKHLNKLLASAREAADAHQNESERVRKQYEELKLKYENGMALVINNAADLQQTIDFLKAVDRH